MLLHKGLHPLLRPAVDAFLQGNSLLLAVILDQLVGPKTLMTLPAIHERIGEAAQMAACYPGLRIHQNSAVHAHIIRILLYEFLPPGLFHIVFQLHTQIAVIPGVCQAPIDLRAGIHEPSGLCQRYDLFHCLFHNISSSHSAAAAAHLLLHLIRMYTVPSAPRASTLPSAFRTAPWLTCVTR